MSTESQHLIRLGNVLAERGAPVERVLSAVEVAGTDNVYLGFSALSSRVEVTLPIHPTVLEVVAPGTALPDPPPENGVIRVSASNGARIAAGVTWFGAINARDAIDQLVPSSVRDAWLQIVNPMVRNAHGSMMNRTKFLTEERGAISVRYPTRPSDVEEAFVKLVDEHLTRTGASESQRALWKALYPVSGTGRVLSITTECTADGPSSRLAITNDNHTFDQAIDLLKVMCKPTQATSAAVNLGTLSAVLETNKLMAVELVIDRKDSDLIVWLPPRGR